MDGGDGGSRLITRRRGGAAEEVARQNLSHMVTCFGILVMRRGHSIESVVSYWSARETVRRHLEKHFGRTSSFRLDKLRRRNILLNR